MSSNQPKPNKQKEKGNLIIHFSRKLRRGVLAEKVKNREKNIINISCQRSVRRSDSKKKFGFTDQPKRNNSESSRQTLKPRKN